MKKYLYKYLFYIAKKTSSNLDFSYKIFNFNFINITKKNISIRKLKLIKKEKKEKKVDNFGFVLELIKNIYLK